MPGLKVGLIGCGQIVRLVHLNILTRLPDVELVALAEIDPLRRESAHRVAPAAVCYEDPHRLLEQSDIEAVVICLPNALHAGIAAAALEKGKHVYLEKPVATRSICEPESTYDPAGSATRSLHVLSSQQRINFLNGNRSVRAGVVSCSILPLTIST